MKIVMIPLARREMLRAARWYERREIGLGDRLLDEIRSALLAITEFPVAFPLIYRRRLLDVFPYALGHKLINWIPKWREQ